MEANNSEPHQISPIHQIARIARTAHSPQYVGHEKHNNQLQHVRVRSQRIQYLCNIIRRQVPIGDEKLRGKWFGRPQLAEETENAQQQRHFQPIRYHCEIGLSATCLFGFSPFFFCSNQRPETTTSISKRKLSRDPGNLIVIVDRLFRSILSTVLTTDCRRLRHHIIAVGNSPQ